MGSASWEEDFDATRREALARDADSIRSRLEILLSPESWGDESAPEHLQTVARLLRGALAPLIAADAKIFGASSSNDFCGGGGRGQVRMQARWGTVAVAAVTRLATRVLAAAAANFSGGLCEDADEADSEEQPPDMGARVEEAARTLAVEAEAAADRYAAEVVEPMLRRALLIDGGDATNDSIHLHGGDGDGGRGAAAAASAVRAAAAAAAAAATARARSDAAAAAAASAVRAHASAGAAIARVEWTMEGRLEQGSGGAWPGHDDAAAGPDMGVGAGLGVGYSRAQSPSPSWHAGESRRWRRSLALDDLSTAAADVTAADAAAMRWETGVASAVEAQIAEHFSPLTRHPSEAARTAALVAALKERRAALYAAAVRVAGYRRTRIDLSREKPPPTWW